MLKITPKYEKIKVLIVEKYEITRLGIVNIFKKYDDIKIIADVDNENEAVYQTSKYLPDVVLLCVDIDNYTNIDLIKKLKTIDKDIKIVVLSSFNKKKNVISCLGAGVSGFCSKTISPDKLFLVIKSVSQGAFWIDSFAADSTLEFFKNNKMRYFQPKKVKLKKDISLTAREKEVLKLVVAGKSNVEIAKEIIVSVHTAKAHVCNILQKMYVEDRVQAAVKAVKENLI